MNEPLEKRAFQMQATQRMTDAAGIPALQDAIRHLYGLEATWLESVPVHETHEGATVWEGEVQVFAVEHPKASRVYAWRDESEGGKRRFHAVLGVKPADGAVMAVRTAILAEPAPAAPCLVRFLLDTDLDDNSPINPGRCPDVAQKGEQESFARHT